MSDLKLGFFENFKGSDSVLATASAEGVRSLALRLCLFAASSDEELPIHRSAWVAPRHPVQLYAVRSPHMSRKVSPVRFDFLCAGPALDDISAKLIALAESGIGHQYFTLLGSDAQLVVSVGEYDASFWQTHG